MKTITKILDKALTLATAVTALPCAVTTSMLASAFETYAGSISEKESHRKQAPLFLSGLFHRITQAQTAAVGIVLRHGAFAAYYPNADQVLEISREITPVLLQLSKQVADIPVTGKISYKISRQGKEMTEILEAGQKAFEMGARMGIDQPVNVTILDKPFQA